MFGVPAVVTVAALLTAWLDKQGALPVNLGTPEEAVLLLITWTISAVASAVGWPVAACRRWGFSFVRLIVFAVVGFFVGVTVYLTALAVASATIL